MPPMNFEKVFIEGGWRAVENYFMPRASVMTRWLNFVGRAELERKRKAYLAGATA